MQINRINPASRLSPASPLWLLPAALVWGVLYFNVKGISNTVASLLFGSEPSSWREAFEFFLYDSAKIFLLLVLMVYALSFLRCGLNVERVRNILEKINRLPGYFLSALFGAVTPFCSCSSIPLFLGFTSAGIPLGFTSAFLITSPVINEVAVVTLWGLVGWKVTLIYVASGLAVGILGGFFIDLCRGERWLQPYILEAMKDAPSSLQPSSEKKSPSLKNRMDFARNETRAILSRIWKWIFIGVGAASLLHGWVPREFFMEYLGRGDFWAVPLSVVCALPLYVNAIGVVPILEALLSKGVALGTALAFVMSCTAASLPEFIMLKQIMTSRLLLLFAGYFLAAFIALGWLLNWIV